MIAISGSQVRSNFKDICDKVVEDVETIIVTRSRGENVVMISETEYNNMIENFRIFSDPERYKKIKNGIDQLENGQFTKMELINE
jgi:antitoxin YefM